MTAIVREPETFSLAAFAVDPQRGFLPARDPLRRLPEAFAAWEELAEQIPALLGAGQFRRAAGQLPLLDARRLTADDERERAMLLLSYFGHAYVYGEAEVSHVIPANIAVPWCAVAKMLKRPPVLSYFSHILYNWRRIDPTQPIALENLARLEHFLGGMDEDWFGMIHIAIEAQAGPGISAVVTAQDAVSAGDVEQITRQLDSVTASIEHMLAVFTRITEKCDPYIYFHRVRPFLSGWQDNPAFPNGMTYEGVKAFKGQPQFYRGGSGAQSAIIPALDDALGIAFDDNPFGIYMKSLRMYMPPQHRAFVEAMRDRPSIRAFVIDHRHREPALVEAYNRCLTTLGTFRRDHLKFTGRYIHAQATREAGNSTEVGTGGTPYMPYLKKHVGEVKEHLIER